MKHRILSLLLAALLAIGVLACTASAEETAAINLYDTTLTVGGTTYVFPMSVADLTAMGVNVPDVSGLTEGSYYYDVPVDDGRNAFSVRVDYATTTEDPLWVSGVNLNSEQYPGLSVGGLTPGVTTMKDVIDACGPDNYDHTFDQDYLTYYTFGKNFHWNLSFESAGEDAKLTRVTMDNNLVCNYGVVTPAENEDQPDAAGMPFSSFILGSKVYEKGATVQDLLNDGWVLPVSHPADSVVDGSDLLVYGDRAILYNGVGLIEVCAYNYGTEDCTLAECVINEISAPREYNSSLICADGMQPGQTTLDAASAILGTPAQDVTEDGVRTVTFKVLRDTTYVLTVDADGLVTAISIDGLNN